MKILILGSSGLIGSTIYRYLSHYKKLDIYGTYNKNKPPFLNLIKFNYFNESLDIFNNFDVIINCIGITKHQKEINNLNKTYFLNIQLPWHLNLFSQKHSIKIIHISSDCVFDGKKGNFKEKDNRLSKDIYGQTKHIAELITKNSLIIRTSTVGHEIFYKRGLLEWFLSQKNSCEGYKKAYFNGVTTLELSKILFKFFINRNFFPNMLLNVGTNKISKFDLLQKVSKIYDKKIEIKENSSLKIDRSLNISKFINLTEYNQKSWYTMIKETRNFYKKCSKIKL